MDPDPASFEKVGVCSQEEQLSAKLNKSDEGKVVSESTVISSKANSNREESTQSQIEGLSQRVNLRFSGGKQAQPKGTENSKSAEDAQSTTKNSTSAFRTSQNSKHSNSQPPTKKENESSKNTKEVQKRSASNIDLENPSLNLSGSFPAQRLLLSSSTPSQSLMRPTNRYGQPLYGGQGYFATRSRSIYSRQSSLDYFGTTTSPYTASAARHKNSTSARSKGFAQKTGQDLPFYSGFGPGQSFSARTLEKNAKDSNVFGSRESLGIKDPLSTKLHASMISGVLPATSLVNRNAFSKSSFKGIYPSNIQSKTRDRYTSISNKYYTLNNLMRHGTPVSSWGLTFTGHAPGSIGKHFKTNSKKVSKKSRSKSKQISSSRSRPLRDRKRPSRRNRPKTANSEKHKTHFLVHLDMPTEPPLTGITKDTPSLKSALGGFRPHTLSHMENEMLKMKLWKIEEKFFQDEKQLLLSLRKSQKPKSLGGENVKKPDPENSKTGKETASGVENDKKNVEANHEKSNVQLKDEGKIETKLEISKTNDLKSENPQIKTEKENRKSEDKKIKEDPENLSSSSEEENWAPCDVCGVFNSPIADLIVYCDGCGVVVHKLCYGIDCIPEGEWYCRPCQIYLHGDSRAKDGESRVETKSAKSLDPSKSIEVDTSGGNVIENYNLSSSRVFGADAQVSHSKKRKTTSEEQSDNQTAKAMKHDLESDLGMKGESTLMNGNDEINSNEVMTVKGSESMKGSETKGVDEHTGIKIEQIVERKDLISETAVHFEKESFEKSKSEVIKPEKEFGVGQQEKEPSITGKEKEEAKVIMFEEKEHLAEKTKKGQNENLNLMKQKILVQKKKNEHRKMLKHKMECAFCPLVSNYPRAFKQSTEGKWVHMACVIYFEEVRFKDKLHFDGFAADCIDPRRFELCCQICESKKGACVQCNEKGCTRSYHPMCARISKTPLYFYVNEEDRLETVAWCPEHIENMTRQSIEAAKRRKEKAERREWTPVSTRKSSNSEWNFTERLRLFPRNSTFHAEERQTLFDQSPEVENDANCWTIVSTTDLTSRDAFDAHAAVATQWDESVVGSLERVIERRLSRKAVGYSALRDPAGTLLAAANWNFWEVNTEIMCMCIKFMVCKPYNARGVPMRRKRCGSMLAAHLVDLALTRRKVQWVLVCSESGYPEKFWQTMGFSAIPKRDRARFSVVSEAELNPFRDTVLMRLTRPEVEAAAGFCMTAKVFEEWKQSHCREERRVAIKLKGQLVLEKTLPIF